MICGEKVCFHNVDTTTPYPLHKSNLTHGHFPHGISEVKCAKNCRSNDAWGRSSTFQKMIFLFHSSTFSRDSIQQQKRFCECQFCVLESLSWMTYALMDERDASDLSMYERQI